MWKRRQQDCQLRTYTTVDRRCRLNGGPWVNSSICRWHSQSAGGDEKQLGRLQQATCNLAYRTYVHVLAGKPFQKW